MHHAKLWLQFSNFSKEIMFLHMLARIYPLLWLQASLLMTVFQPMCKSVSLMSCGSGCHYS